MRVGSDVACDIFNSCNKNPYVATLASGQSAPGFLEFMGSNAVQTGKTKISFSFTQDPTTSMIKEMYPCNMEVGDTLENYPVSECGCNYCETACKPSNVQAYPSFFDGFNIVVVSIVYVALIILSVIIFFVKRKWHSNQDEDEISNDGDGDDAVENGGTDKSDSRRQLLNYTNDENESADYGKINKSSLIMSDNMRVSNDHVSDT
jgi:hypothetical protein